MATGSMWSETGKLALPVPCFDPPDLQAKMSNPASAAEHETPDQRAPDAAMSPPRTILGILRQLGPGLIIAGAIVGSGELNATTKTGAQAGFWL